MPWIKRQRYGSYMQDRHFKERVDRRLAGRFDFAMAFVIFLLAAAGALNLYSAVYGSPDKESLFDTQLVWLALCVFLMVVVYLVNYQFYEASAYWILGITCVLLIIPLIHGVEAKGAARWIAFGSFRFQPSELSKIALIFSLARYFTQNPNVTGYTFRELLPPAFLLALPTILIAVEPDLGTAVLHVLVFGSVCLFVGVRRRMLLAGAVFACGFAPVTWFLMLKDYQRERILTLINPERDPLGAGYHIRQSLIAIGSGKFFGKGYLAGTQTKLQFLPEQHTDFVFSVLAEEWGFLGCAVVLILFFILIAWGITVAAESKDRFGSIAAFGLAALLFWQVVINVGMVLGLVPVVGVVLPFFSYGRSSLFAMFCVVTLLLNINSRRYMFN